MKLGITQYAACPDGREYIETAVRLGLDGVEPFIPDVDSEFYTWSADETQQFRNRIREVRLLAPSVAVGVFNNDPAIVESAGYDRALGLTIDSLRFTSSVGATVMLLCTFIRSHPDTDEKKANLVKVVKTAEPMARRLGIRIGLESPIAAHELAELVDGIESDFVGVYYDVGNSAFLGFDPAREIEILGNRIISVHLKDSATALGDSHLGRGRVDLRASLSSLKRIRYNGWLILETPAGDQAATMEDIRLVKECWQAG